MLDVGTYRQVRPLPGHLQMPKSKYNRPNTPGFLLSTFWGIFLYGNRRSHHKHPHVLEMLFIVLASVRLGSVGRTCRYVPTL